MISSLCNHLAVIHLVDMVGRQHKNIGRVMAADNVDVLVNRVGRALVPRAFHPLLRRQQFNEFVEFTAEEAPALLDMPDQRMRLVLREYADATNAGVDAVGEREIDDAELAAERHRRFGVPSGQILQPRAAAAGEDKRERFLGQPSDKARVVGIDPANARFRIAGRRTAVVARCLHAGLPDRPITSAGLRPQTGSNNR